MLGLSLTDFSQYWCLCEERFGRAATVARLEELAAVEVQALTGELTQADAVRMHSVGVAATRCIPGS